MSSEDLAAKVQAQEAELGRLRRSVKELSIINEIATAIGSAMAVQQILDLITQKCVKHMEVEQGAVLLLDTGRQENQFHTVVRRIDQSRFDRPYRLDVSLTGWMLKNQQPLVVNDLARDPRFQYAAGEGASIRSLLSVPLMAKGKMIGQIALFNKKTPEGFSHEDQRMLAIIATQSAQVIENARLLEEEAALARMQEDLRLAYEIQVNLLPTESPALPGYELVGKSLPAKEVGGDFYDFIPLGTDRLAFSIGDISGKGMPAALLMSNVQATVRTQTLLHATPAECVQRANTQIYHCTRPGKFASMFYAQLQRDAHHLRYVNAGHNYPYLITRAGEVRRLEEGGVVLGVMESFPFAETAMPLAPGDLLLLYSDGITEAVNDKHEEFGEERMVRAIADYRHKPAEQLIRRVVTAVQDHAMGCAQSDDMTLVILKRVE